MTVSPRFFAVLWDVSVIVLAGTCAYSIRFLQAPAESQLVMSPGYISLSALAGLALWSGFGLHRRSFRHATQTDAYLIGLIAIFAALIGLTASFLLDRGAHLPRSIVMLHVLILVAGLFSARVVGRLLWQSGGQTQGIADQAAGGALRKVLLLGDGPGISMYLKALGVVAAGRKRVAAVYSFDRRLSGLTIRGQRVGRLGDLGWADLIDQTDGSEVDRIVVAAKPAALPADLRLALGATRKPVRFFGTLADRGALEASPSQTLADPVRHLPDSVRRYLPWKRLFDVVAATSGLLVAALPLLLAALAVRIVLGAPVMFWQWRPGRGGQSFRVVKLRSMRAAIDSTGRRLSDAERLGTFGNLLRRSRLDELPQLFSVLVGDMSLIGPRPLIHQQQKRDSRRLLLRPGLTGWAQVNGGQLLSETDKEALDLWYVGNLSPVVDLKILIKTVVVVLLGDRVPEGFGAKTDPLAGDELFGLKRPADVGSKMNDA